MLKRSPIRIGVMASIFALSTVVNASNVSDNSCSVILQKETYSLVARAIGEKEGRQIQIALQSFKQAPVALTKYYREGRPTRELVDEINSQLKPGQVAIDYGDFVNEGYYYHVVLGPFAKEEKAYGFSRLLQYAGYNTVVRQDYMNWAACNYQQFTVVE